MPISYQQQADQPALSQGEAGSTRRLWEGLAFGVPLGIAAWAIIISIIFWLLR